MPNSQFLEEAVFAVSDGYCSINLTKNIVPGVMYQVIDGKKYDLNKQFGIPRDSKFTDLISAWAKTVPEEGLADFLKEFDREKLLERFQNGEHHISFNYWTRTSAFGEMYSEEHIVMYRDRETGDVMAVNYMIDRTEEYRLKQRTAVINGLGRIFSEMYYIDLKNNTIQKVASQDLIHHERGENKDARETLKILADTEAVGSFRKVMRDFWDYDTMDQRLGKRAIISQEYVNDGGQWIRCSIMPAERDKDKKNLSVICVQRPITAEKEELAFQDNLIQALAIPYENTYAVNADTGETICYHMEQTMSEQYGHKYLVGNYEENIEIYIENDVLKEDRKLFDQVRRLQDVKELLSEKKTYYFNYRVFRQDEIKYYQCQYVKPSLERNEFVVGFKDVDEEKRQEFAQRRKLKEALDAGEKANAALQEEMMVSEALSREYHSLFKIDSITGKMSLYRTDGIGMDKSVLENLMKLEDYEGGILDKYIESFVAPEDQERVRSSTHLAVLREKVPERGLYKVGFRRIMNGVSSYYQMNTVRITDKNGRATFIMGMRNVDDRVKKERLQEQKLKKAYMAAEAASKAKTNFLFNMSHDIRTPMNAIIGFTDLLEKHLDDKEAMENYIAKIKTSNEFLLSLINNVLEMARIESGKMHLDTVTENAYDFQQSVVTLFDSQMKEKGILFLHSVQVTHPDVVIDQTKMREILLNLLSNALKYTSAGGMVTLTLKELPSDKEGYAVYQTVVEDTGIGMSDEFLPHIFEDFSREHSSTESRVSGTGLGTAIVKKLVDLMHGTIEVESKLGEGTKFTLTMRHLIAEEKNTKQAEKITEKYRLEDLKGKRILLAEDNELNAEIAIAVLEEAGFLVERAEDGVICVDMIEKSEPDHYNVILMDIQMPNMDGYKATQVIRRLPDKKKSEIPIIAMTANAFEEDRRNAFQAGMNGHIAKPIHVDELLSLLAEKIK